MVVVLCVSMETQRWKDRSSANVSWRVSANCPAPSWHVKPFDCFTLGDKSLNNELRWSSSHFIRGADVWAERLPSHLQQEMFSSKGHPLQLNKKCHWKLDWGGKLINKYINKSANKPSKVMECQKTGGEEGQSCRGGSKMITRLKKISGVEN